MGKGSGGCDGRQALCANMIMPSFSLADFRRAASECHIMLPNGEQVHVVMPSWKNSKFEYTISDHYIPLEKQPIYSTERLTTDGESEYPLSLLYTVAFNGIPSLVKAIESLVGDDVRYSFESIRYVAHSHGELPRASCMLMRVKAGWQSSASIEQADEADGYTWIKNIHLRGFETRQAAIDAINEAVAEYLNTSVPQD